MSWIVNNFGQSSLTKGNGWSGKSNWSSGVGNWRSGIGDWSGNGVSDSALSPALSWSWFLWLSGGSSSSGSDGLLVLSTSLSHLWSLSYWLRCNQSWNSWGFWCNWEGIGFNSESIDSISNVVDTNFLAIGVNVSVRSTDISESITDLSSSLTWMSITVASLSEFILSMVLGLGNSWGNDGWSSSILNWASSVLDWASSILNWTSSILDWSPESEAVIDKLGLGKRTS